jgi:hypothetical protein
MKQNNPPVGNVAPSGGGSIYEQFMASQQPQQPQEPEESFADKAYNLAGDVVGNLMKPASMALDAISYLDKPRGAIAGTVKAAQDGTPLLEGAQKGWQENTSWKETFPEQFVKEDPYYLASIGGLAADIVADPLVVATPAKLVKGAMAGSKAIGLTDAVMPTVNAIKQSERGQKYIALAEDWTGVNRAAEQAYQYNKGRAIDAFQNVDIGDAARGLAKEFGEDANPLFNQYVQAAKRPDNVLQVTPNMQTDILDLHKQNKLTTAIKDGVVQRENAFDAFRNAGEEVPNYLLDVRQSTAKADGVADAMLPVYQYRDEILASIPDQRLSKAIQRVGDSFIEMNKKYTDSLANVGRLGDEALVHFPDGSHLRRSFDKWTDPEKFLEDLRKNGSDAEYIRAYEDLQKARPNAMGNGAKHKVDLTDFANRQNLSTETLKKLGVIENAEYRAMDTLNRASKTIREEEYLSSISQMFAKPKEEAILLSRNLPERRRYVQVPDSDAYGSLKGQWIPKDVHQQVMNVTGSNASAEGIQKSLQTAVSWWKIGKLANPASIMRNFYSGLPMANVFGQVPLTSLPKQMAKVTAAWRNGGKNNPLIREIRQTGILGNQFTKQELQNVLQGEGKIKGIANKAMDAFGAPDQFWRAVVYSHYRDAGKSIDEAAKIANKALLDYSQAPEWINAASRNGIVPFAKFPWFAGKETAKALYNRPAQVTKYTKAQNQTNTEDREKLLPDYMRASTLLPIGSGTQMINGKERKVDNNIDIQYILPFASDVSLGNPLIDALQVARTNRNSLGMDVVKPGMTTQEKAAAYAKYGANSIAPAVVSPYSWEKLYNGATGRVDEKGRQYGLGTAAAQVLGGIKNVPINTDELAKQKIRSIQYEIRNNQSMINSIKKDPQLADQQKKERIISHQRRIKELAKDVREVQQAYRMEKKREAL